MPTHLLRNTIYAGHARRLSAGLVARHASPKRAHLWFLSFLENVRKSACFEQMFWYNGGSHKKRRSGVTKRVNADKTLDRRAYRLCFDLARHLVIETEGHDRARAAGRREGTWRPLEKHGLSGSGEK